MWCVCLLHPLALHVYNTIGGARSQLKCLNKFASLSHIIIKARGVDTGTGVPLPRVHPPLHRNRPMGSLQSTRTTSASAVGQGTQVPRLLLLPVWVTAKTRRLQQTPLCFSIVTHVGHPGKVCFVCAGARACYSRRTSATTQDAALRLGSLSSFEQVHVIYNFQQFCFHSALMNACATQ